MRSAAIPGSVVPRRSFSASGGPMKSNGRSSSLTEVTGRERVSSGSGSSGLSSGSVICRASPCWPREPLLAAESSSAFGRGAWKRMR